MDNSNQSQERKKTMEFDEAFKLINAAILAQAGRQLSAPEVTLLKGTWQGMTYEQMADNSPYSLNYLMRDIGPKFWRLLSSAMGKEVSKTNIRLLLEQQAGVGDNLLEVSSTLPISTSTRGRRRKNAQAVKLQEAWPSAVTNPVWDVMPEIPVFCGRDDELDQLNTWVLEDNVQVVSIHGLSGVGKTALARMFIDDVQGAFEHVLWRSISHQPPLSALIANLFEALEQPYSRIKNPINQLVSILKKHRCLLILDGIEAILDAQQLAGQYAEGYEDYGELFRQLADVSHQSCLIMTGLEAPADILMQTSDAIAVRPMELQGLQVEDARALLESERLEDADCWDELIKRYSGYPGALTAVSSLSHTLFNGKVSAFLQHQTFVFGEINHQLQRSFSRLSPLEKEVLFFLALQGEPLSFLMIESGLTIAISGRDLFEVLASLRSRSLILTPEVKNQSLFALSSLVMEYVTGVLIAEISGGETRNGMQRSPLPKDIESEEILDLSPSSTQEPVRLSQWFDQNYPSQWEPMGVFFSNPEMVAVRLRSTYHLRGTKLEKRFKRILLGNHNSALTIALIVSVTEESAQKIGVRAQVQPLDHQLELPENLSLSLLNGNGENLRTMTTQKHDHDLRLPLFRGEQGDQFMLQIDWSHHSVIESFVI
ncbi:DUF1822 family protein [Lyngbya confervoides]|uniref:DUF1822 family protein n=1 Tax=Lyngbya confervoides BDU141951 TaxID=1574623 RepID=A0ABD4T533_9CYAN|nr:DUF1822 family protein [Lyngbya confervoides]MCM1983580.1 DUF1822 family protein [Lyngbya confervoides BDU141951]